jgi:hypothetical protein
MYRMNSFYSQNSAKRQPPSRGRGRGAQRRVLSDPHIGSAIQVERNEPEDLI